MEVRGGAKRLKKKATSTRTAKTDLKRSAIAEEEREEEENMSEIANVRPTRSRRGKRNIILESDDEEEEVERKEPERKKPAKPRTDDTQPATKRRKQKKDVESEQKMEQEQEEEQQEKDEAMEVDSEEPTKEVEEEEKMEEETSTEPEDRDMSNAETFSKSGSVSLSASAGPGQVPARADTILDDAMDTHPSLQPQIDNRVASSVHARANIQRLVISKIELTNFKSYAGTRTIGPFHHKFSAVVGPNGSGKSNLIDALLFVFGYRSSKLRLKKISELIHTSNHGRDIPEAKVEIFFEEIQDIEGTESFRSIENSSFSVSRTATADNKSTYYLNNKKVKYEVIQTKLKEHHIDLDHNRFLILQGEVEQISQMKPKGLTPHETGILEYIEDIIGSNRFLDLIEKAEEEVHQSNIELAQQINRVKAVEEDKSSLKVHKDEAELYRNTQGAILDKKAILEQLALIDIEMKNSEYTEQLKEKDELLGRTKQLSKDYKAKNAEMESEYSKTAKEHDKIAQVLKSTKESYEKTERNCAKLNQEIKNGKSKIKSLKKTIKDETKKQAESQRKLDVSQSDLQKAESSISTLKDELAKEEKELEKIQKKAREANSAERDKIEVLKNQLIPKKEKVEKLQAEIDVLENDLKLWQDHVESAQHELEKAEQQIESTRQRLADAEQALQEKKRAIAQAKKAVPALQKQLDSAKEEEQTIQSSIDRIQNKLETAKLAHQEEKSQNIVLRSCLEFADSSNTTVYGRLGDLGSIDAKYDVAISTASRGNLDCILVQTKEDATACVNYLKDNNVGRATFLALDEMTKQLSRKMVESKSRIPAGSVRLFDLIHPKRQEFLPAFYSAVSDTLVAETFQEAKELAFNRGARFRVVTLDGAIIESSGVLSGGGNRREKGGMRGTKTQGETLSKQKQKELQDEIRALTQQLRTVQSRIGELEREIEEKSTVEESSSREIPRLELEIRNLDKLVEEMQERIPELRKKASQKANPEDKKRIAEIQSNLSKMSKPLEKAKKDCQKIEEEIQELQNTIMNSSGMPLKIQQARVDGISSQIDDTLKAITRLQVQAKTAEKTTKKIEKALEVANESLESEEKGLETKKESLSTMVEEANAVKSEYEKAQEELDGYQDVLKQHSSRVGKLRKKLAKLRLAKTDLKNQRDILLNEVKTNEEIRDQRIQRLQGMEQRKAELFADDPSNENAALKKITAEEMQENCPDPRKLDREIRGLEEKLSDMSPNMAAIAEYRAKEIEYNERMAEKENLTQVRDEKRRKAEELRKQRLDEFMSGFRIIRVKLKEMYRMITLEGDADLEFVDSLDPFSDGIVFTVRPPKKSWKNIANLSGGEKTLSSLALVFALHHYKPTPLYFMDEIDAALDFKNVSIIAHYIKERTKNAQFIIISLRNNMFELADRLVGIYKPQNCTYTVAITPNEFQLGNQTAPSLAPVKTAATAISASQRSSTTTA